MVARHLAVEVLEFVVDHLFLLGDATHDGFLMLLLEFRIDLLAGADPVLLLLLLVQEDQSIVELIDIGHRLNLEVRSSSALHGSY